MDMTGRITHSELEKFILKSLSNTSKKLICCKITISKEIGEAQKLIKHLKLKERCARFKVGDKSRCNFFDFYIIPPTKANKYLNYKFVANNFNATIQNKKMWGVIIMPIHSFKKVNNEKIMKSQDNQSIHEQKKKHKKRDSGHRSSSSSIMDNSYSPEVIESPSSPSTTMLDTGGSVLDDNFFTNLDSLATLLDVDSKSNNNNNNIINNNNNNNNVPVDPRKRR